MSRKGSQYRIVLRGKRGFSKLRYATSFEIWYGRKRIVAPTPFPTRIRKAAAPREAYLNRLVTAIEVEKQKILVKRRRVAKAKAKAKEKERKAKIERQKIGRAVPEPTEEVERDTDYHDRVDRQADLVEKERPDFANQYQEEPQTLKSATIQDVVITPIIPKNNEYKKRLIDKVITSADIGTIALTILDYTLNPEYVIPMDADSVHVAYMTAFSTMIPHIFSFFNATVESSDAYILRLKFAFEPIDRKGKRAENYSEQGVSITRIEIRSQEGMTNLFRRTFKKLLGLEEYGGKYRKAFTKNYLEGQTLLYITGFTLEATTYTK